MALISRSNDRNRLSRPRGGIQLGVHYDPDAFGEFSEGVARFLGTGRFLVAQTIIVTVWILLNVFAVRFRWDPYPFILLNLGFSTQAAYAAPLILLAQNRQAERDRSQAEFDRQVNQRTQAEAEFLARELASVRISLADAVTTEDLDRAVERIIGTMERARQQREEQESEARAAAGGEDTGEAAKER
jgi:uncharacterized membrane protein